jgi:hypothetical protein
MEWESGIKFGMFSAHSIKHQCPEYDIHPSPISNASWFYLILKSQNDKTI